MGAKNRSRNQRKSDKAISKGVDPKNSRADLEADGKWSSQHHLPIEILEKIIGHLDVPSLKSASAVCEYWRTVIESNSKYLLFHGKTHTEKETIDGNIRIFNILFVGHGLLINYNLHLKKDLEFEDYDGILTVFDDEMDKTWEVKTTVNRSDEKGAFGFMTAQATDRIVVIEKDKKSSYGIWSRSGDYISTVEVQNIGLKLFQSSLLFLLPDNQFGYLEVKNTKNKDLQHIKNDKLKIEKLIDFYNPFALVLSYNGHLLALKINNGLDMVGGVSRKKKSSRYFNEAKIAPELIVMIEMFGKQKEWYACWELNIFDFDGNNLFRTAINEKWGSQHLEGFYHLQVDFKRKTYSDLQDKKSFENTGS